MSASQRRSAIKLKLRPNASASSSDGKGTFLAFKCVTPFSFNEYIAEYEMTTGDGKKFLIATELEGKI